MKLLDKLSYQDRELLLVLNRRFEAEPERRLSAAYEFVLIREPDMEILGHLALRVGDEPWIHEIEGHLGYGILPAHRNQGYARRACKMIAPLLQHHGIDPVIITCNPGNLASIAVIEALGGRLLEVRPVPEEHPAHIMGDTERCRYELSLAKLQG